MKALLFLVSMALMQQAMAQPCRDLEENSCWHVSNNTEEKVTVSCLYKNRTSKEVLNSGWLAARTTFSYQHDRSWADGLGYAVSPIDCQAKYGRTTKIVHIPAMPFGARVAFRVESNQIIAIVHDYWNNKNIKEYRSHP